LPWAARCARIDEQTRALLNGSTSFGRTPVIVLSWAFPTARRAPMPVSTPQRVPLGARIGTGDVDLPFGGEPRRLVEDGWAETLTASRPDAAEGAAMAPVGELADLVEKPARSPGQRGVAVDR
jgi:hypothetical protein